MGSRWALGWLWWHLWRFLRLRQHASQEHKHSSAQSQSPVQRTDHALPPFSADIAAGMAWPAMYAIATYTH